MQSIWLLTKKNLQLLLRSKGSALIIIFAPLFLILILALTYNTQGNYSINIGVYSVDQSNDSNVIIAKLQEQNYTIIRYNSSIESCIDDLKAGYVHTCLDLPGSLKLEGNAPKEIMFYVDPSRTELIYAIEDSLKTSINFKSQEITKDAAASILGRLSTIKSSIEQRKTELNAIKDKNSAATTNTAETKTTLQGLDLTAPTSTYNKSIIETTKSQLNVTTTLLEQAVAQLNTSNTSVTDKLILQSYLENITASLAVLSKSIDSTTNESITLLVASIEGDLRGATAKLTAAQAQVSTSSTSLDTTTTNLQESITSLESLSKNLDEVINTIQGQKTTDPNTITSPITTTIQTVSSESTYLNYLFPTILILIVMFGSLLLGTTLVMIEKNSPAFLRNYFVPLPKIIFVLATYLTNLILVTIQITIILLISLIFLSDAIGSFPAVALVLFLVSSIFTFLGMIVGYLFASEETATLGSISLGTLFLTISGVILPIEATSKVVQDLIFYNPFVIAERIIRQLFIFNSSFGSVLLDTLILVGYMVVLLLMILLLETLLHKHLVERFTRNHHKTSARHQDKPSKSEF